MADPVITLPTILNLPMTTGPSDPGPVVVRDPILVLPDQQPAMQPLPTTLPSPMLPLSWANVPSATVNVTAKAPLVQGYNSGVVGPYPINYLPMQTPPTQPVWWQDPLKLGLLAAGVVALLLLTRGD